MVNQEPGDWIFLATASPQTIVQPLQARLLSFTLREGWRGAVGTCSGGTNYRKAGGGRRGAVAGLHVFRDATVGGQLMAKGRAELWELLLGLCGGQKIV